MQPFQLDEDDFDLAGVFETFLHQCDITRATANRGAKNCQPATHFSFSALQAPVSL